MFSVDCFHTLGKRAAIGRGFLPEEFRSRQDHVAGTFRTPFWRRHFNAASDVLGRTVSIESPNIPVVGVLPRSQAFPENFAGDIFRPLVISDDRHRKTNQMETVFIIGHLKPNLSSEQALAALTTVRLPQMPVGD